MSPESSSSSRLARRVVGLLILAIAIVAVYSRSLSGELVYDDRYLVAQNPDITSLSNVPRVFTSAYWDFLDEESAAHVGYYRPLASVLLMIGWAIGEGDPSAFHWISILTHVLATWAAWLLASRLARSELAGFCAAFLFALHPLQVESVAWISAVNVPLFALFSLLSLASYLRWREEGSRGVPWVAGLLLLPALFSKEAAVAVVLMALAIDLGRTLGVERARSLRAGLLPFARAYAPFAVAGLMYYAARVATFGDWLAGFDRITTEFRVDAARLAMLRIELLGGAGKLLVLPADLNLFRAFVPELDATSRGFLEPLAWTLALAGGIAVLAVRRARPWLAMALLVPAAIFPVLTRVQSLGTFPLSDRFLYLPVIGFTMLLALFALRRMPRPAALAVLALVGGIYAARTVGRIGDWQNEVVLFHRALAQNPHSPNVYWGLGRVLLDRYRQTLDPSVLAEARGRFDQAMDLLEEAGQDETIFATEDDHRQTNLGLGWSLLLEAQLDAFHDYEAPCVVFQRVTHRYPTYDKGYVGVGVARLLQERPDEAAAALRKALELNPRSIEAHHNMGQLLLRLGDYPAAEEHFRRALDLRRGNLGDLVGLASSLELQDRIDEADAVAREALRLHPDAADPMVILGNISVHRSSLADAHSWFLRATRADPRHWRAYLQLGSVLGLLNDPVSARPAFSRASELNPESFEAAYNLAMVEIELAGLEMSGEVEVFRALLHAYRLRPDSSAGRRVRTELEKLEIEEPDRLWALGAIDYERGDREGAEPWVDRCLEHDPGHALGQYLKGTLLRDQGRFGEALGLLQGAATQLVDSYQVQYDTGTLMANVGHEQQALPYLRSALELLANEPMDDEEKLGRAKVLVEAIESIESVGKSDSGAGPESDG